MRKLIVVASVAAGLLTGCDQGNTTGSEKAAKALVDKSVSNMVPVQGGEFLMGDFGPLVGEKLPFSIQQDDKNLHKVILSGFSISKYKVTNDDFNVYLKVIDKKSTCGYTGKTSSFSAKGGLSCRCYLATGKRLLSVVRYKIR